jgi:hypothetical protein
MLTEEGEFSLQKGVGTLEGRTVGKYLSNKHAMSRSILA